MKKNITRIFVLLFVLAALFLAACGDVAETTDSVCEHLNLKETHVEPTCEQSGYTEKKCEDCGFMEHTDFAPKHNEAETYLSDMGITGYLCADCGDRSFVVKAGRALTFSTFCGGEISFSLTAAAKDEECELMVDGQTVASAAFDENGRAELKVEGLERGGHVIKLVNGGASDIRVKAGEIDGYFSRPGALFVEVLGKGSRDYSAFNIYVQTNDPSEEYYVCYPFQYEYNTDVTKFAGNTRTNIGSYRVNGAVLYKITMDFDEMKKTNIASVLGGGEISYAVRQANPYLDQLAEGATEYLSSDGSAPDFIGGYHGDEWLNKAILTVDGQPVDLGTSEKTVFSGSVAVFDLDTTMYAWGTATTESRGIPVIGHGQRFVLDSTGVTLTQTIEWLRDDYTMAIGYMPMFTMMRGQQPNRFIDTMRMYDAEGNLLEEYTMAPEEVTKQTSVMYNNNVASVEYDGIGTVTSRISFRSLNDEISFGKTWIALRTADNKLYVPVTSAKNGATPVQGETWIVETQFMIDYLAPETEN